MRRAFRLLRFFHIVAPVPRLMVATVAVVTLTSVVFIVLEPSRAGAALVPVLLLQLFAAASGFAVPARRGHYDLILTTGESRLWIAVAHWLMSILPGLASWGVLAIAGIAATRGAGTSVTTSGSVAALILVSTVPWALTVSLPRFAGAIGWLSVLALVAVSLSRDRIVHLASTLAGGHSWVEALLALLLYPPVLIGESLVGAQGFIVVPALLVSAAAMINAVLWIDRCDVPLEAAQ